MTRPTDADWSAINGVAEDSLRWCLIHADNADVLPGLKDKSVTHVITDPPYHPRVLKGARGLRAFGEVRKRDFGYDSLQPRDMQRCAREFGRLCQRWCLVFSDAEISPTWAARLKRHGIRPIRTGAWIRLATAPQFTGDRPAVGFEACAIGHPKGRMKWNGGGMPAVWHHHIVNSQHSERLHSTPKPLTLMLELVQLFTDPNDIVLDPFAGSGTTGVACLRLGRRFIGIERDEKYAAVARERLQAESQGLKLRDARAGQQSLFGEAK